MQFSELIQNFDNLDPSIYDLFAMFASVALASSMVRYFENYHYRNVLICQDEFLSMSRRYVSYSRRLISARLDWVTLGQL